MSDIHLSSHNCYGLGQKQCVNDGYRTSRDNGVMQKEHTIFYLNHQTLGDKK